MHSLYYSKTKVNLIFPSVSSPCNSASHQLSPEKRQLGRSIEIPELPPDMQIETLGMTTGKNL